MVPDIRIGDLLKAMKLRAGNVPRLAGSIGGKTHPTEKTVRTWLKKSEDELRRLHPDNIEDIVNAARNIGEEPLKYAVGPPLWNVEISYQENLSTDSVTPPGLAIPFKNHARFFLGHPINSAFGASASVMTSNAQRIRFLAQTGADVITYKTVRSTFYKGHPTPNIFFSSRSTPVLDPDASHVPSVEVHDASAAIRPSHGMMNRFGMPSTPPEVWQPDFKSAKNFLRVGQLLILSIVGTAKPTDPPEILLTDFVRVFEMALAAGAEVIELNLSCPNCSGMEGTLYHNTELVVRICEAISKIAGRTKVLLKIGFLRTSELEHFVLETCPYVHGYSCINSISALGLRDGQHGPEPAFGRPGLEAGLSGPPIIRCGLRMVQELINIFTRHGIKKMGVIGIGGAMTPADVKSYLDSGADVVQAATAFFVDSYFGIKVRSHLDADLRTTEISAEQEQEIARVNWSRAVQQLKEDLGTSDSQWHSLEAGGLAVLVEWERMHSGTVDLGPRRRLPVPSVEDFKDKIRNHLAAR